MALFIGLMSGTSIDGVDAVLTACSVARPRPLDHVHCDMPEALRRELLALNGAGENELHRAALATNALMVLYAQAVATVCRSAGVESGEVTAIGAHGQTVRHRPGGFDGQGYTLQLVNGALLAELTGIDVVCDFRSRDVAAGGQGAPLVPAFHAGVFARVDQTVAVLNLGGVANITVLASDGRVSGWDTGPANLLMDGWIQQHCGEHFDRGGQWAAQGRIDPDLLTRLRAHPFFAAAPPKSTGRDEFNATWLARHLHGHEAPADVMATLAELTVVTAADAVRGAGATRLEVCGGGAANAHLMRRLAAVLPGVVVTSTAEAGVPPDQVEAMAFAWLAWAFMERKPGNLPDVTGARGPRVLGALYPAR